MKKFYPSEFQVFNISVGNILALQSRKYLLLVVDKCARIKFAFFLVAPIIVSPQ